VPHEGDWRKAEAYRHGMEHNNPLLCRKTGLHPGKLPKSWGLLEVSKPNVIITALKLAGDGSAILRFYEASGVATNGVKITCKANLRSAYEANLIEDTGNEMKIVNGALNFDLGPYEIKTLKLKFKT